MVDKVSVLALISATSGSLDGGRPVVEDSASGAIVVVQVNQTQRAIIKATVRANNAAAALVDWLIRETFVHRFQIREASIQLKWDPRPAKGMKHKQQYLDRMMIQNQLGNAAPQDHLRIRLRVCGETLLTVHRST